VTKRETLGTRLAQKRREKAAREHRDIQQIDVAKAAGVSKASISRYENDVDMPRDAVLERLAKFLGTTPAFLRYGATAAMPALRADEEQNPEGSASALARENERKEAGRRTGGKKRPA
jgi:transcriptional regulator with XRE-family HTH domain